MADLRVEEGLDTLPALREEWDALFAGTLAEPSTSHEWTSALARCCLEPGDRGFLITLRRSGHLVGVLPLVHRTRRRVGRAFRTVRPLSEVYNTRSDMLVAAPDPEIMTTLVRALARLPRWDTFEMSRCRPSSQAAAALLGAFRGQRHVTTLREGSPSYLLELPSSLEAYLQSRSRKFRSHLHRTERKLHAAGAVRVHDLTDARQLPAAYEAILEIERASWKHDQASSIAATHVQRRFYRELAEGALARGRLHLHWMTLDDRPVAYNLGFITASGYYYLKTSYADDTRPLSPSTVLRARLIGSLIARGIRRVDFCGEPYAWEAQWATALRRRVALSARGRTPRGHVLSVFDRLWRRDEARLVLDPAGMEGTDLACAAGQEAVDARENQA